MRVVRGGARGDGGDMDGLTLKLLSQSITNFDHLNAVLNDFSGGSTPFRFSLETAIERFTEFMNERNTYHNIQCSQPWDFFTSLLPKIIKYATDFTCLEEGMVPLLRRDLPGVVRLSSRQVLHLMGNAFFLNVPKGSVDGVIGDFDLSRLYSHSDNDAGVQRVLCLLSYFAQAGDLPAREIVFERLSVRDCPSWRTLTNKVEQEWVSLHDDSIDTVPGGLVAFSQRLLHGGAVLATCTDEDMIFNCFPECFVGILFNEEFSDRDGLLIKSVRKYSTFNFFNSQFAFEGFDEEEKGYDIVVMDGSVHDHFSPAQVDRDLNKAWGCFSTYNQPISTTFWGRRVHADDEDETHTFLIQLSAAILSNVKMNYSTFFNPTGPIGFKSIIHTCELAEVTIGELVLMMDQYYKLFYLTNSKTLKDSFHTFVLEVLKRKLLQND